jgi:Response regulator containing CheY-like receiver, AAA-type ATPase, and DNA-binding domains
MSSVTIPARTSTIRSRVRSALVASPDRSFRQRLSAELLGLRWHVREAEGGADAWTQAEQAQPEAMIIDSWLPDLDMAEFMREFRGSFPLVDLIPADSEPTLEGARSPYRQELLYALRRCQESDTAAWNVATDRQLAATDEGRERSLPIGIDAPQASIEERDIEAASAVSTPVGKASPSCRPDARSTGKSALDLNERIPELIGNEPCMLEVSRRIRLVAPRSTPVLIEGPTGSGKELVAEAVHRLSVRNRKPFVAINCAAIPEALLEAELFGHTRGAFTGAVHGRVGRIEAADGGTLFLDEIGELPLALQSKLLRFVECGELQRVGDNEAVKVDVRILAATHRPLAQLAQSGSFRSDLYYRLAVFLIRTPALLEHKRDLPLLVEHFLEQLGKQAPVKRLDQSALAKLQAHDWPGNVREVEHVLERAAILAGDNPLLTAQEIDFGVMTN